MSQSRIPCRHGRLLIAAAILLALAPVLPLVAQSFPASDGIYYWKVGDGVYSDWVNNYSLNGAVPATGPGTTAVFGYPGTPATATISLDPSVASGFANHIVRSGTFTFNLNGSLHPTLNSSWTFGDESGSTPIVNFTGPAGSAIIFNNLTLGANGSSNNVFGGTGATITFDPNVTRSFASSSSITIGSTAGGGGNVLNLGAGDAVTVNDITINAGAGNLLHIQNGGTFMVGNTTVNVGAGAGILIQGSGSNFTRASGTTAAFNLFGTVFVEDGASFDFTSTSTAGKLVVNSGATFTVDGAGSEATIITRNSSATSPTFFDLGGRIEALNGGSVNIQSSFRVMTADAVAVVDAGSSMRLNTEDTSKGVGLTFLNASSKLTLQGGGILVVEGVWSMGTTFTAGQYRVESNDGTVLHVDRLSGSKYIPVKGKIIVGGATVGATQSSISLPQGTGANSIHVGSGTHLELNLDLNINTNSVDSIFIVDSGGILGGQGKMWASSGRTTVQMNGGEFRPGRDGMGPGTLKIQAMQINSSSLFSFDIGNFESYDQVIIGGGLYDNSNNLINTLKINLLGGVDDWVAGDRFRLFQFDNGDTVDMHGNFTYDFGDTAATLAASNLAWDTTQFSDTGDLYVKELGALANLSFNNASPLADSQPLTITNTGEAGAQVAGVSIEQVSGLFDLNGLSVGNGIQVGTPRSGTAALIVNAPTNHSLNGTYRAKVTLQFAEAQQSSATWEVTQTISGRRSSSGSALLAANADLAGFGLISDGASLVVPGETNTVILAGTVSQATTLQMNYLNGASPGSGNPNITLLSEIVDISGLGSDEYVLSMTYDPVILGSLGEGFVPYIGWDSNPDTDLWDWVNAVNGNIGGIATYHEGAWQEFYELGAYGWDASTGTAWAVLNHNSSFAVISSAVAVPEPGRVLLLGAGLIGMFFRRRRGGFDVRS